MDGKQQQQQQQQQQDCKCSFEQAEDAEMNISPRKGSDSTRLYREAASGQIDIMLEQLHDPSSSSEQIEQVRTAITSPLKLDDDDNTTAAAAVEPAATNSPTLLHTSSQYSKLLTYNLKPFIKSNAAISRVAARKRVTYEKLTAVKAAEHLSTSKENIKPPSKQGSKSSFVVSASSSKTVSKSVMKRTASLKSVTKVLSFVQTAANSNNSCESAVKPMSNSIMQQEMGLVAALEEYTMDVEQDAFTVPRPTTSPMLVTSSSSASASFSPRATPRLLVPIPVYQMVNGGAELRRRHTVQQPDDLPVSTAATATLSILLSPPSSPNFKASLQRCNRQVKQMGLTGVRNLSCCNRRGDMIEGGDEEGHQPPPIKRARKLEALAMCIPATSAPNLKAGPHAHAAAAPFGGSMLRRYCTYPLTAAS